MSDNSTSLTWNVPLAKDTTLPGDVEELIELHSEVKSKLKEPRVGGHLDLEVHWSGMPRDDTHVDGIDKRRLLDRIRALTGQQ